MNYVKVGMRQTEGENADGRSACGQTFPRIIWSIESKCGKIEY